MTPEIKPRTFGIIGVVLASLALLAVLVGPAIHRAVFPRPTAEERIADAAFTVGERFVARLKGKPVAAAPAGRSSLHLSSPGFPDVISLALTGAAIIGGSLAYLRREDHRLAYVACGVGTLTLAWHAVVLALGALILCVIIFAVWSALGFG